MSAINSQPDVPCVAGTPLISCAGLRVGYHGKALLPPIDFELNHGELCGVVGRNGSGKTTWFRTLMGLLPPVSGTIHACRTPLPIAYIPQRSVLDPIVPLRACDVVAMGLERGRSYLRPLLPRGTRARVRAALDEMGAGNLWAAPFSELSEGQKQRVLMARVVVSRPELAVLDEPTAAMDEVAEREALEQIDRLRREHDMAVMIVSHHLPAVSRFADKVVFLDREAQNVVAGPPSDVFSHPAFVTRYGRGDDGASDGGAGEGGDA